MSQPTLEPMQPGGTRVLPSDTGNEEPFEALREGTPGRRLPGIAFYGQPEVTDVIGLLTDSASPARVADPECGEGFAAINVANETKGT